MPARKTARDIAFQFLYGKTKELPKTEEAESVVFEKEEVQAFCKNFEHDFDEFTWELIDGVRQNLATLDQTISRISTKWKLSRIPLVDLTILRLGTFEIQNRQDIPRNVAINEAVELAKKYGEGESASFVNGILDKVEKKS